MNKIISCQNIKKMYHNNCNDFVLSEIAEIELKFIALFIGLSGIVYLKNNKELLSELLFQIGYKSFLVATKLSNACRRIKNFFVFSDSGSVVTRKRCIYDEVKVIKNGVRHASFETMATFKESSYLGNPNHYYNLNEDIEECSSSFDSDIVDDAPSSPSPSPSSPSPSSPSPSSPSPSSSSPSSSSPSSPSPSSSSPSSPSSAEKKPSLEKLLSLEPLFLMEKNDSEKTLDFKNFDFIMHTNYRYPESHETSKQNYTKIYRTFTENDFSADKTKYETSTAEMIICTLQIDDDGDGDGEAEEYEIDLLHPYNFNVVGNLILDEKFVYWYILKKYNYAIEPYANYKITCITKDIKTFQLDRSCGLRVHLNEYEEVHQSI
jgi:hypothetical protein